jgi:hypothetical protein
MNRLERRAESRQIIKELKLFRSHRVYLNALKNEDFSEIVKRDLILLKDGTHPDSAIQMKYGQAINLLSQIVQLEKRLQYLQTGFRGEVAQNLTTVQE